MDILTVLKKNVSGDTYDKVFNHTMMHIFKDCDVLNAIIEGYRHPDTYYKKLLDEFMVFQNGSVLKFGNDDPYSSNKLEIDFKNDPNFDEIMEQGLLRLKYLRIVEAGDYTSTFVEFSDFISYAYNYDHYNHTFFLENSHEVTIEWGQISMDDLVKLVQRQSDKSFIVSFRTDPFEIDPELADLVDVAETFTNVKLKIRYFFAFSLQERDYWEDNYMTYVSLLEHSHPRIEVFTCVFVHLEEGLSCAIIYWLRRRLNKLGYDKINHFLVSGDLADEDYPLDFYFVKKMTNLEKLTIDGEIEINEETFGDLSGLHKLRRLKITHDEYSNEWLSTCLPDSIERMSLFKDVKKIPQYYPIKLGEKLKCLVLKHNSEGHIYYLNIRDFDFKNSLCDVHIEDIAHACRMYDGEENGSRIAGEGESDSDMVGVYSSDSDSGSDGDAYIDSDSWVYTDTDSNSYSVAYSDNGAYNDNDSDSVW